MFWINLFFGSLSPLIMMKCGVSRFAVKECKRNISIWGILEGIEDHEHEDRADECYKRGLPSDTFLGVENFK